MSVNKYPLMMRLFHWTIAVLVIGLIVFGLLLANGLDKVPNGRELVGLHKSFGVLVFFLVLAGMFNRYFHRKQIPVFSSGLPFYERWLAWLVHRLFYVCLLVMPISGYLMSCYNPKSSGVAFFGIPLPSLVDKNESLAKGFFEMHEITATILIVLISLHVLAVIKHRFIDKGDKDSLSRMI